MELLAFVEGARYDEATNVMSVAQCNRPNVQFQATGPGGPDIDPITAVLEADPIIESAPTKMLQVESGWAAVVKYQTEAGSEYLFVRDDITISTTVVQQNNANCIAAALHALTVIRTRSA